MARLVVATLGSHGDVNPYLVLGKSLKARGHTVVIATFKSFQPDVERSGLEFAPLCSEEALPPVEEYGIIMDRRRGPEYVIRKLIMPRVREQYELLEQAAVGADLLLSHPITYAAPVLAEKKGLRWLSTVLQPMIFFSSHDPPVLSPATWLYGLMRRLPPGANRSLIGAMKWVSRNWPAPLQDLRRDLGLSPARYPIFEGQHSPFGILALFSRFLGRPQPDWPPNVHITGFLFHDEDIDARPMDPQLEEFLDRGEPPVVLTFGSSAVHIAEDLYRRGMRAIQSMPGRRAVILAGTHADALRAETTGDRIHVAPSAPYYKLFPRCAAIVHQAGAGTLAQAMRSGKPMLIIPFSHDQFDNGRLAEELGIARSLRTRRAAPRKLAGELDRILGDPAMGEAARRAGEAVRQENGAAAACEVIERQLVSA